MEFIAALAGLTASAFLLDRVVFALGKYLNEAEATSSNYDQMNLWALSMVLVILPLTILLYMRTRTEELDRFSVANTKLRRFFLYTFMLGMLGAAVVFAVIAVYSLQSIAFGAVEVSDTLLLQAIPATIAAAVHAYIFRTFMRPNTVVHIKEFAATMGVVGFILFAALLLMSSLQARNSLVDDRTSKDLKTISIKVDDYYRENGKLPSELSQLGLDKSVLRRGEKHDYTYTTRTGYSYKLCATFRATGIGGEDSDTLLSAERAIYPAPTTNNFYAHDKGKYCFELSVGSSAVPLYDEYQTGGNSSSAQDLLRQGSTSY